MPIGSSPACTALRPPMTHFPTNQTVGRRWRGQDVRSADSQIKVSQWSSESGSDAAGVTGLIGADSPVAAGGGTLTIDLHCGHGFIAPAAVSGNWSGAAHTGHRMRIMGP